jgi:hypothetical protein
VVLNAIDRPVARVRVNVELRARGAAAVEAALDASPVVRAWARNPVLDGRGCLGTGWFVQLTGGSASELDELRAAIPRVLRARTEVEFTPIVPRDWNGTPSPNPCRPGERAPRRTSPTSTAPSPPTTRR